MLAAGQARSADGAGWPALRVSAVALFTAVAAGAFPHVPAWGAALLCGALGIVMALPTAADAALRRGHGLSRFVEGGLVQRLLAGPVLRLGLAAVVGAALALLLLARMSAGGPAVWVIATVSSGVTALALQVGARPARAIWAGPHAGAGTRWLAQVAGAAAAVLAAILAGQSGVLADPAFNPAMASALTGEVMALHRLWAGAETWLLGQAVALSLIPSWLAASLVLCGNAAVGWAVARLTVAALMPPTDLRRALAPASDAAIPAHPSPVAAGGAAAAVVAALVIAVWSDGRLAPMPPEARPVAALQVAADRIGDAFFPPGTVAAALEQRADLARTDADLAARMRDATNAGFDRVVGNVDPFLDGYYSLWGEYARLFDWSRGQLEDRLQERLADALAEGAPFADLEALHDDVEALRARAEALGGPSGAPLPPVNPGQVRILAALDTLPPLPDLRTPGMTTSFEVRAGVSLAMGAVAGVVAQRVIARLAARGVLAVAVRAVPIVGVAVGLAADAALVELEEAMNREAFRAEIVAAIEDQRQAALAFFD